MRVTNGLRPPSGYSMRPIVILMMCAGCSFAGVRSHPRSFAPGEPPKCASWALPTLDLAGGLSSGGIAGLAFLLRNIDVGDRRCAAGSGDRCPASNGYIPFAAIAAIALASATYGYVERSRCGDELRASSPPPST